MIKPTTVPAMSRRPTRTLLATIAALGLLAAAPLSASAASGLQQDVDQIQAAGAVSVVAQTNVKGVVTSAVAGTNVLGTASPVSPDTHYRTGSVTKTFVSATLLQLVGEGRLSLDDTVDRWLPGLIVGNGNDGTRITVRELLQHTSGLFDYTTDQRFLDTILTPQGFYAHRYDTYTPTQLIGYALSHAPNFAPGTQFSYSNTNYIVAGQIIKAVTGSTWDVEVTRRIIAPLGLTGTSIPAGGTATIPAPFADGYNVWSPGVYSDTTLDNMTWADAAGKIITTTRDEITFYSALLGGKVLRPAQLTQMKTTVPVGHNADYGLGIGHLKLCNTDLWTHSGGVIGYETVVATTPDGSITLAMDEATSDITGSDPTLDGHLTAAADVLLRHAFCGSTKSTDSYTQLDAPLHGKPIK